MLSSVQWTIYVFSFQKKAALEICKSNLSQNRKINLLYKFPHSALLESRTIFYHNLISPHASTEQADVYLVGADLLVTSGLPIALDTAVKEKRSCVTVVPKTDNPQS